jgi:trehalose-phosphatase
MFDFDGTLVPIAQKPDQIQIPKDLPQQLLSLQKIGHHVAIVSGRRTADIKKRLNHIAIEIIGLHGLEGFSENTEPRHPLLNQTLKKLKVLQKRFPKLFIEDKEQIIAVHTRDLPEGSQKSAMLATLMIFDAMAEESLLFEKNLHLLKGQCVVELRPDEASKALAVQTLIDAYPQLYPIYIGDDSTDEEAFPVVNQKGTSIRVGAPDIKTTAFYRLADVSQVYGFLNQLLLSDRMN